MSKLLIRPSRYPDECVVSYLIRVSERNGFRHIGHLLKHAGLTWKNLRVPTHQMITGEYDTACYFTQLGLDYTSPRTAHIYNVAQTASFSTKLRSLSDPQKPAPNASKRKDISDLWSYLVYTSCTKHKLLLIDTCPNTGKSLSWCRHKSGAVIFINADCWL